MARPPQALHVMLPDIDPGTTALLKQRVSDFKAAYGREVVSTFVPAAQIDGEVVFELRNSLNYSHDGWIVSPASMPDIYSWVCWGRLEGGRVGLRKRGGGGAAVDQPVATPRVGTCRLPEGFGSSSVWFK